MNYNVVLYELPTTIKAFTINNPDGCYTVIVNSRLSDVEQRKSCEHELKHIYNCDFEKEDADEIEFNIRKEVDD